MSRELLNYFNLDLSELSEKKYSEEADLLTIHNILDILGTKEKIPNEYINRVADLALELLKHKLVRFEKLEYPFINHLTFNIFRNQTTQDAILISPTDYLEQVKEDPIREISRLIGIASKISDYGTGRNRSDSLEIIEQRSSAYQVEFLRMIERVSKEKNIPFYTTLGGYNLEHEYPKGLASLDPKLLYMPPEFNDPDSE